MSKSFQHTFLLLLNFLFVTLSVAEYSNVPQVIQSNGYSFEEHTVQTEDGYILTLFRIPTGKNILYSPEHLSVEMTEILKPFNPELSAEKMAEIRLIIEQIAPDGYHGQSKESIEKNVIKLATERKRNDWMAIYNEHVSNLNISSNSIYGEHQVKQRPVVFLQHGILSSSASWVLETGYKAPAFFFADAGFDVWLGNARGSVYSRRHVNLDPKSFEFWDFSWDEMADYDIPAVIDYVTKKSRQEQIYYVGHSMGTTMFYAAMSLHPEYNSKIKGMIGLAPVASTSYIETVIKYFSYLSMPVEYIFDFLKENEFMPENSMAAKFTTWLCKQYIIKDECESILFAITGADYKELDVDAMNRVSGQLLSGTSLHTVLQFGQEYTAGNYSFQKFDFGPFRNLIKYWHVAPPQYNLNFVTVPVALMWGQNDYLADAKDVQHLADSLPNVTYNRPVPCPSFNHLDFLWAKDAIRLVYEPILKILASFE